MGVTRTVIVLTATSILMFAPAARAQAREPALELSVMAGRLFGGTLPADTNTLFDEQVDVADARSIAGRAAFKPTNRFEAGFHLSSIPTTFQSSNTGLLFGGTAQDLGKLRMTFALGYTSVRLGAHRSAPYLTFGVGAARLAPETCQAVAAGCHDETKFTAALGAGVKVFLRRSLGVRFDSHYFATALPLSACPTVYRCDKNRWLSNGDASAGVIWALF